MSPSPAASSAGTWEVSPAPSLVLPRSTAWWLGGKEKGRVGREPRIHHRAGRRRGKGSIAGHQGHVVP